MLSVTWEVALDNGWVEAVSLFEALTVDVIEGVEMDSAVSGYEGKEG